MPQVEAVRWFGCWLSGWRAGGGESGTQAIRCTLWKGGRAPGC